MSLPSPRFSIDTSTASSPISPQSTRTSYPFPDRTASFNRYHPSRRGSNASAVSSGTYSQSIGGSLDTNTKRRGSTSSVREISQNAISTLLQPPIVRTGLLPHTQASAQAAGYRAPTTRDIPPVTLTTIPRVPQDNFNVYLKSIKPLFDQLQRGRLEAESQQWIGKPNDPIGTPASLSRRESLISSPDISRLPASISLSSSELPESTRRRGSGQSYRNRNEPTPLSTIPSVYFDEDFHLENPRTFDAVSERAEIVRPPEGQSARMNGSALPPRKALATNAILQEKLSWYMDTVEVHLINNISTASTGFFAALGSLKELQEEAEQSIDKIQRLRQDLKRLDEEVAISGLEVAAKKQRQENVQKLRRVTEQVQRVVEEVKRADDLVDGGNYKDAADQIETIGKVICGDSLPGVEESLYWIDLRPMQALQGLGYGINDLQHRIGAGFASQFTTGLLSDIRKHSESVPHEETLKRLSRQRGISPRYMETSDQLRKDLEASLEGLAGAGHTTQATAAFREAAMKEVKSLIRRNLPSSSDDDAESVVSTSTRGGHKLSQQEKSSILARNLRALDPEDAEKMLVTIYAGISETLRRLSTLLKVLLDVSSRSNAARVSQSSAEGRLSNDGFSIQPTDSLSSHVQEDLTQALDMSSLLEQAVDTAQNQITRVLKVRNEQTIRMPKERFLRYFTLNKLFADECEAVSGQGGQALKGVINAQISGFIQVSAQAGIEQIAQILDSDMWDAKDFTPLDDSILQRILGGMTSDSAQWTTIAPLWEAVGSETETNGEQHINGGTAPGTNGTTETKKAAVTPAYIDETRFILVTSAIQLLPIIDGFLSMTASIPSITPQVSAALLDVLKTFNSRSCQLILGAGATRSAGLRNITTKHLALASQALSFVIALIPYIRECARRHLSPGNVNTLAEFDKTKRLFQDHQSGIHDKLVEIMTSRSTSHVKSFMSIDFDSPSAGELDSEKASPYMETLTKETLTLHRVLSRHLTDVDVSMIMRRIFESYKDQWIKAFSDKDVEGKDGEKRLLRDANIMEARLSRVKEFEQTGEEILKVLNAKQDTELNGHTNQDKGKEPVGRESVEIVTGTINNAKEVAK